MVAQTRHANKARFDFRDKLSARGLTTDALHKKLQGLYTQLAKQDQDDVDKHALATARAELIHRTILLHKDQGVRAYTACCLAELLRLYAPDAPYTQPELRDIFQFFIRQLKEGLKNTESAYHNQYFQLLESLSTVKSAVLICDLPSGDDLMLEFFTTFFYIVRRGTTNKKMESFMADILVALMDECQSVPQTVLDTILAQFMDNDTRMEQPAYRLAITICNSVADKLQRPVCQYFTDIIVDSAHDQDEDEDDKFDQLTNAHELIKRLHQTCPAILHSVIPQLGEELRVDHVNIRQLATQALGKMYADKNGSELATKYPATWDVWISRKNDKSVVIRLGFVESLRSLIMNLPLKRDALADALEARLLDPDEKVRTAVCKLFSQLDYESALHNVSEELLRAVVGRCADKKAVVRSEALNSLGKLYSLAYPEIENNDVAAIKHFGWIPNSILEVVGQLPLVRDIVDRVFSNHILPLTTSGSKSGEVDEVAWTEKLLNVMKHLSDKSIEILISLSTIKESRPSLWDKYLDACIQYNGGIIDEDEEKVTHTLNTCVQALTAWIFSNDHKASEDLHSFAKLNENRLYKLLKTCFNPQTDIKSLAKSSSELLRRVDQQLPSLTPTLTTLLLRGSLNIINQSSIPTFLKKIQKRRGSVSPSAQLAGANATTILKSIAKYCPRLFKSHIGELCRTIVAESSEDGDGNKELLEVALQAVGNLVRVEKEVGVGEKRTLERMVSIAVSGDKRQAKFATRFLVLSSAREVQGTGKKVLDQIVDQLEDVEDSQLASHVAALVQFARYAPEMFEEQSDVIMQHLVKRVLNIPIPDETVEDVEQEALEEWYEDPIDIPELLWAKISTLKLFRHRCLNAAASNDKEKASKIVVPVMKMLVALMTNEGAMSDTINEDPKAKSRMRLQASLTMLHLARMEVYTGVVMPHYGNLVLTIQDTCYGVRSVFLNKLIVLFLARKLPPPFGVIFFLTVHDPEEDVKQSAEACVRSLLKKLGTQHRVEYFELLFIRLLHTLAHHPDFSTEHEDLLDLAKYIQFYLDLVATADNISLLYHLASKGKTVRDHMSFAHSENLYMLCELAQYLIKARSAQHSWSIQSYPGKVRLPADILRPLPNVEAANRILKTAFLPDETIMWIAGLSTQSQARGAQRKERKAAASAGATAGDGGDDESPAASAKKGKGKRKASSSRGRANGSAKRSRRKNKWDEEEEEEDENEGESGEGEGEESEGQGEEGSDTDMKGVGRKRRGRHKGNGKEKTKAKKAEEDREAREAKGLRTSARTRAKAQAVKKKPKSDVSGDEDGASGSEMET